MSASGEDLNKPSIKGSSRLEQLRCVVSVPNDALPLGNSNGIRRYRFCVGAGVDIMAGAMSASGEGLNKPSIKGSSHLERLRCVVSVPDQALPLLVWVSVWPS